MRLWLPWLAERRNKICSSDQYRCDFGDVLEKTGHSGKNQVAGASKERTAKNPFLGQQRLQSTAPYVLAVIFRIGNATVIPVYGRHEYRVQGQYGGKLRLA
jgi:hypothetical protein